MTKFKDYYEIMGIERDATQDEIKRAYRKLARKYHPDVSKASDAEERFKDIGEAYAVLKDPDKRAAYDQLASGRHSGEEFQVPPDWGTGFEFRGAGPGIDAGQFSDFFESLFRGGGGFHAEDTGKKMRGQDHHARIRIALEDSYQGATRSIVLQAPEMDDRGHVTSRQRTLSVRIPKGVVEGQSIRLAGQGSPVLPGGTPGDLYIEIEFEPHSLYRVDGRDVYLELPVTPWEAALGTSVNVPTLGGRISLKIPPGSQSGKKLRLRGRGLPAAKPGDQYVVLQIVTPQADTEEASDLYRKMAQVMPMNPRAAMGG